MLRCKGRMLFGWLLILGLSTATVAAETTEATVSGTGEVTLRPVPTMLRVRVELSSQGGTVEMALARLQQRREAAMAKLKASEADADSIQFDHPIVSKISPFGPPTAIRPVPGPHSTPVPAPYQSTRPAYGPPSSTYAAPVPAPPASWTRVVKVPPLYRASTTLSVDWPLAAENMDEVLVASEALKKKIAAADLAGAKQPDQLTPEQQEILEEAAVRPSAYETSLPQPVVGPTIGPGVVYDPYGPPQAVPNGVQFLFVARISPEQRKAALAKAFAKAKAQAEEMAGAAGRDLGPLASLNGQFHRGGATGYCVPVYPSSTGPMYDGSDLSPDADESAASDSRSIVFQAQVHATFRLP